MMGLGETKVDAEQLQRMIALLEEEARLSGFEYSADFLKIAASSLVKEISLSNDNHAPENSTLEIRPALQ